MTTKGRVPSTCPHNFQGRYTVQRGDTMFLIAKRFRVSLQSLINANPHIANPNAIFPGDVLCVPKVTPPHPPRVPTDCPPGFKRRYTVTSSDTMFLIAKRFGVSLQALINANPHIPNPNVIFPGDVLCVPGKEPSGRIPQTCPPNFQGRYTVRTGETMFLIAQKFGVSLQALINANPHIPNPNQLVPGDVLCVPE
ncbi:LysM peptidoglycan-binding domain-containing protein [Proteinivorax tanatarense]|uniref:LysM peptidoglycan-binding domain-containing protein n=1 Tax=Proteinivorax tanatarense TaxID=1260629 RepID=A0AAU7VKV2_9FIRM